MRPHPVIILSVLLVGLLTSLSSQTPRPNIILAMADDMGWGDPGYNSMTVTYADGTPHPDQGWIQTPTMDTMAANGIRFDRFYSAAAVCSPTRASSLTGRNPYRVGIPYANTGKLGFDETPLSEVLAAAGYRTGHFGKWHLGSMTTLRNESNRGGNASVYSAPWHHSYDFCFATESKVPTYHPYRVANNNAPLPTSFSDPNFYGTYYWRIPETWNYSSGEGDPVPVEEVNNAVDGDDSKLIVDQAIPFIQDAVSQGKPFFVVLWFHTPHKPVTDPEGVSGVDSSDAGRDSIEDMDAALGMLRNELETLGVRGNTMFWVTSDNGPENGVDSFNETSTSRSIRSGRLRERKRSLYEGGVRVPGILEWPDAVASGFSTDMPVVTSDYYSTILDMLELSIPGQKPLDGVSLRPLIESQSQTRTKPIGFKTPDNNARSWMGQQYKLINGGSGWELYDLVNIAPGEEPEQTPVATAANIGSQPQAIQDVYNTMLAEFQAWEATLGSDTPYVHASQPTVSLSTAAATVTAPFSVTAEFSEPVEQLHVGEIVVSSGTASALSGSGTTWTFTVTPLSSGDVIVSLPEGTVIDSDGNINAASNDLTVSYSNPSQPDVSLASSLDLVAEAFDVTATFEEDVTGLDIAEISVTNGTAAALQGGPAVYTFTVTPAIVGTVSIQILGGVAMDLDGNINNASNLLEVTYDPGAAPATIANGDLNTSVPTSGSTAGDSAYTLTSSNAVTENESSIGRNNNEWVRSTLSRGFAYDAAGGAAGEGGAFVNTSNDSKNQKPRAVLQFAADYQTATGPHELFLDVFADDNSAANALTFLVELYAWNAEQTAPALSLGGATANVAIYNVTTLNDAVTLKTMQLPATDLPDASWKTAYLGSVDLGAGYDFYAWRIGIMGQESADQYAFDNVILGANADFALDSFMITPTGAASMTLPSVFGNVDVYRSLDLQTWTLLQADVAPGAFSDPTADGLDRAFYFAVPAGQPAP